MNKIRTLSCPALVLLFLLVSCKPSLSTSADIPTQAPQPAPTQEAPALMDAEKLAEFEAYARETMKLAEVPGMSIAIVENRRVIYAKGFGVRELGREELVTPDTQMMIGSTSKPLTCLMMASVVDDGLMQWDTPVTSILPAFAVADASPARAGRRGSVEGSREGGSTPRRQSSAWRCSCALLRARGRGPSMGRRIRDERPRPLAATGSLRPG